jgi:hypothetical protein
VCSSDIKMLKNSKSHPKAANAIKHESRILLNAYGLLYNFELSL